MHLRIEPADASSVPGIVQLMREFAAYEKLSAYCTVTESDLNDVMFGRDSFVKGIVARDGGRMIAYALFYRSFASFRGQRGYFLEDIFIDTAYRGRGIGAMVLKEVARAARRDNAERIDFLVLAWNEPALRFYEALGAVHGEQELHFKFSDEAFERLAD